MVWSRCKAVAQGLAREQLRTGATPTHDAAGVEGAGTKSLVDSAALQLAGDPAGALAARRNWERPRKRKQATSQSSIAVAFLAQPSHVWPARPDSLPPSYSCRARRGSTPAASPPASPPPLQFSSPALAAVLYIEGIDSAPLLPSGQPFVYPPTLALFFTHTRSTPFAHPFTS